MDVNTLTLSDLLPSEWGDSSFEAFEACAAYSEPLDCITYLQKDEAYRADRIDHFLTILWHPHDDEVIGIKIKGVRFLFETMQSAAESVTGKKIGDEAFIPLVGAIELALKMQAGARISEKYQKIRSDEWLALTKGYELARGVAGNVTFDAKQLLKTGSDR